MYKTKDISVKELEKIEVKNQQEIQSLTGSKLDLKTVWEVIKKDSKDFTQEDLKAIEADELLHGIVSFPQKGIKKKDSLLQERYREKERAKAMDIALKILELELSIAA